MKNKKNFCKLGTSKSRARPGGGGVVPRGMGDSEVFSSIFQSNHSLKQETRPGFKTLIQKLNQIHHHYRPGEGGGFY